MFHNSLLISTVPSSTRRHLVPFWPANSVTDQATQTKAPFLFLQPPRVLKQASNSHSCGKRSTACKHFEGLLGLSGFISIQFSVCEKNQVSLRVNSTSGENFWFSKSQTHIHTLDSELVHILRDVAVDCPKLLHAHSDESGCCKVSLVENFLQILIRST